MNEHGPRRPHPESVVLEIGGEIGALLLYTDAQLLGAEVEISRSGHDDERQHKEVLQRPLGGRTVYAAAYDGLHEGTYTLWLDGEAVSREVRVRGGGVATCDWRAAITDGLSAAVDGPG
jgi:hypothetical protein